MTGFFKPDARFGFAIAAFGWQLGDGSTGFKIFKMENAR